MKALIERNIPALPPMTNPEEAKAAQKELYKIMQDCLYGVMPPAPEKVEVSLLKEKSADYGGKIVTRTYSVGFETEKGYFAFPFHYAAPAGKTKVPFFVHIDFEKESPNRLMPTEEIVDRGYGVAAFCYTDVTSDSADGDGLMAMYSASRATQGNAWGKLCVWAFAASRVLDAILTLPEVDADRVAVIGLSRLGKTALWAGASDERFIVTISNESGCGGAALNRGKIGESLSGMTDVFPYWFCPNMSKLRGVPAEELVFDSHFLFATIAPRHLLVGSAIDDEWADPTSELLACHAASPAWSAFGKTGFICDVESPVCDKAFHEGTIGYHMRSGGHYLLRTDWNHYMDYRDLHRV